MSLFAKIGFDAKDRLLYALRTAIAAVIALLVAWAIGLEHPQWAAMSVWAGSQPLRGQLLEKGALRIAGTIIGTFIGILLVQASLIHPMLLVIGLALWMTLCTALNNLLRGFIAYGAALAGYTAAMVSLLDVYAPDNVLALGIDRFLTVITGVGIAMLVGMLFAPSANINRLRRSMRELVADGLTALAEGRQTEERITLMARIASAEEDLDPHAAGSLRSHAEIKSARLVLLSLVALLLRHGRGLQGHEGLLEATEALRAGDISKAAEELMRQPHEDREAASTLSDLSAALQDWAHTPIKRAQETTPLILHRDWIGAREASLRSFGAIMLFGVIWQVTGWHSGNFMLLGLSIMISLFSSFENPSVMMRSVIGGQILGICAMLICRWLVWPHMESQAGLVFSLIPFILLGTLVAGNRHSAAMSFDYNMILLLLSQPNFPLTGSFQGSLMTSASIIAAPIVAWGLYKTIFPPNLKRRIATLEHMIASDLAQMAGDPKALSRRLHWRARLYHRTLRLMRMSSRFGRSQDQAVELALHSLRIGQAIMAAHLASHREDLSESQSRAVKLALARSERFESDPSGAERALHRLAQRAL